MVDLKVFARKLRKDSTDAEKKLWQHIRAKQLCGFKFRRQQQLGPYIADFYCSEKRLVVELDGGQHADNRNDAERDTYLESKGIRVVRIWNNDIFANVEGVLEYINILLEERVDSYRYFKKRCVRRKGGVGIKFSAAATPPSRPSPLEGEGEEPHKGRK